MDWRKPVREYIPEFRLHDAVATDRVTVRDLLCHHSGLPRHDWIWLPGDLSPAKMLAAMRYFEPSDDIRNTRTNWPYTIFVIMPINGRLMDTPRRSPRLKRAACSSDGVLFMLVEVLLAS